MALDDIHTSYFMRAQRMDSIIAGNGIIIKKGAGTIAIFPNESDAKRLKDVIGDITTDGEAICIVPVMFHPKKGIAQGRFPGYDELYALYMLLSPEGAHQMLLRTNAQDKIVAVDSNRAAQIISSWNIGLSGPP